MRCVSPVRARRGVAAVELAVALPLLLLLLLGIWEVGRMVEVQQLLSNAVREGGRQASTGVKTIDEVKDVVVRYLKQNGVTAVTANDVTVINLTNGGRSDPTVAEQLDRIQITISVPFNSVRWVVLHQITNVQTLSASSDWYSMRNIPITVDYSIPVN
jgi:Flp pilus assembly protein TadG